MSYIIIPSRRTRQPQGLVHINWNNPLTCGLTYFLHEPTAQDLVTPRFLTASSLLGKRIGGKYGQEYRVAYTDSAHIHFAQPIIVSVPCTLYAEIYPTNGLAAAGWGSVVTVWNTAITHVRRITMNGVTGLISWQEYNGTANGVASQSKTLNSWLAVAAVSDSTAQRRLYVDDVASADDTTAVTGIVANQTYIGSNAGGNYWDGGLRNVRAWARALSGYELAEHRRFPFAMLVPDVRRIYFGAGGGTGPSTYDVTYADSKSLTDAISNLVVFGVTYSDTKTLTDTITSNLTAVGGYSESISLSDSDTGDVGAATYTRDVEESITLTDSYTTQLTGVAAQTETIDLQETYTGSGIFGVAITETISLTDNQVQDSAKLGDVTETISLSDAYSSQLVANSGYSDTIDLQDLYSSQAVFNSEITDSQSLTDTYAATVPGGTGDGTLTPETIDLIADEVMSRLYENPVRRM